MSTLPKNALVALMVAAPLTFGAADANAQATPAPEACQITVTPSPVHAGSDAQQVSIQLSQAIGNVDGLRSDEASGLRLSTADELPRTEMSAEGEEPQPVQMSETGEITLWVNTSEVEEGTYPFVISGENGQCQGTLTIQPAA